MASFDWSLWRNKMRRCSAFQPRRSAADPFRLRRNCTSTLSSSNSSGRGVSSGMDEDGRRLSCGYLADNCIRVCASERSAIPSDRRMRMPLETLPSWRALQMRVTLDLSFSGTGGVRSSSSSSSCSVSMCWSRGVEEAVWVRNVPGGEVCIQSMIAWSMWSGSAARTRRRRLELLVTHALYLGWGRVGSE